MAAGRRPELAEREGVERVDEEMLVGVGDLDEADAFPVVVEAVGLRVEREREVAAQAGDEVVERLRRVDPEKLDFR